MSIEPLLKLSTIVKHETIEIESKRHPKGKLYELINLADLGPFEHAQMLMRDAEVRELNALKKPTPAQKKRIDDLSDETMKMLIPSIEPSVLRELTTQQKQSIAFAWVAKITESAPEGPQKPRRRTTAARSRGSRSSTAATPSGGSTRQGGR